MSQIRAITINNATYNVAQASAVDQKKLMLLLGGKIALHSAAGGIESINVPMLVGSLITLPEATFDEVSSIVLRQAFINGTNERIDVKSFQGGMMSYFKLVAEAVAFNLDDFFTWLDVENAERRANKQTP